MTGLTSNATTQIAVDAFKILVVTGVGEWSYIATDASGDVYGQGKNNGSNFVGEFKVNTTIAITASLASSLSCEVKTQAELNGSGSGSGGGISISGGTTIGSVLTATLPSSFLSGSGQWFRDSSAISGKTASTYTTVTADADKDITFRGTLVSNAIAVAAESGGGGGGALGILRFGAAGNRLNNKMPTTPVGSASNKVGQAARTQFRVGSGDQSEIRFLCPNFSVETGGSSKVSLPGNTLTIVNMALESAALATSVRITFSGSNSIVLPNGEYAQLSDPVLPSAFGLTKFTVGEIYYTRTELNIPVGSTRNMPMSQNHDYSSTGGSMYNADTTAPTNIIGTGSITGMTGSTASANGCWKPLWLGKFVSGDPRTILGIGDSIMAGVSNSGATANVGVGVFGALLHNGGTAPIAGCNAGVSGGYWSTWSTTNSGGVTTSPPELLNLVKYATDIIDNYGTNNNDNASNIPNSQLESAWEHIVGGFSLYYTNRNTTAGATDMTFWRWNLSPRTTSNASITTTSGQTPYGEKWQESASPICNTDYLNDYFKANNSASNAFSTPYKCLNFDSLLRGNATGSDTGSIYTSPAYHAWLNGNATCTDGTHLNNALWVPCAASAKATMGL